MGNDPETDSASASSALRTARDYHQRTKHRFDRHARSLGYMDWETQPDPFRVYEGTARIELERPGTASAPAYDDLFLPGAVEARPCDVVSVSRLFFDSVALSAWKSQGQARWSLRVNPSSGNLHPTESYLLAGPLAGLCDGPTLFHYAPLHHALEPRGPLGRDGWSPIGDGADPASLAVGLTSIHWRESWKYGERAFRYCHLDVGHAQAAFSFAAAALGWCAGLDVRGSDADLARLLGVATQSGPEAEHPDCLIAIGPRGGSAGLKPAGRPSGSAGAMVAPREGEWAGRPNRLSRSHHAWPLIDEVARATRRLGPMPREIATEERAPGRTGPATSRAHPASEIVRRRRSAVAMDGSTGLDRESFFTILERCMRRPGRPPFDLYPWRPAVDLVLFVHRVEGLDRGLYLLRRSGCASGLSRDRMGGAFDWHKPDRCPDDLPLHRLARADTREAARRFSCGQDIASDGAFAVAMIAEFEPRLRRHGAWFYKALHWEAGAVGQLLYLEAEACGLRATGIGCFFDDPVHEWLGLEGDRFQDLYHFTVGGAVEDPRLRSEPAYDPR